MRALCLSRQWWSWPQTHHNVVIIERTHTYSEHMVVVSSRYQTRPGEIEFKHPLLELKTKVAAFFEEARKVLRGTVRARRQKVRGVKQMNANTGRGARIRGEQLKSPALIRTHPGVSRNVNSPTPVTFPYTPLLTVAHPCSLW